MSAQATFCATLVDEWARAGLTDAVVSPGSRSTPLAVALVRDGRLAVHVVLDERSASFRAVGIGLATGQPAVLVCTSGTAAAEYHAAVVEAHQAAVPLIACTADRPPELQRVGAPQTIDQVNLFGASTRWSAAPGVPDYATSATWRSLAARAVLEATGRHPGPVHLNLAFREPLGGDSGDLPPGRPDGAAWHRSVLDEACGPDVLDAVAHEVGGRKGVVVAGARCGDPDAIVSLASTLGWPVLADPRSGCDGSAPHVVCAWESLLRATATDSAWTPEAVIRFGEPPASKTLAAWLAGAGDNGDFHEVVVRADGRWLDPSGAADLVIDAPSGDLCAGLSALAAPAPTRWAQMWVEGGRSASAAIEMSLAKQRAPSGPAVARGVFAGLPGGSRVVVSSSMPVRDLEWFATPRADVAVFANRGANGIDGVVSTAVGVATVASRHDQPTVALLGDLAFLHDVGGLSGVAARPGVDLVVVVIDNSGGGIFSFLPQRSELDAGSFERLFGTPQDVDLAALAGAYGATVHTPVTVAETTAAVTAGIAKRGLHVVLVDVERDAAVTLHAELHQAVAADLAVGHG